MGDPSVTTNGRKLLDPSELGTKEYWEKCYERELKNHTADPEDEGINWFEESNAEDVVLKLLSSYDLTSGGGLDREDTRFLDLGTGNGHMLFALREDENEHGERWLGDMLGVDYSPKSVELAKQINEQRKEELDEDDEQGYANVELQQWDLLTEQPDEEWLRDGFEVVLDKGTFDAISLMPTTDGQSHPCEVYRERVVRLIKPANFLIVTSCNWTKEELVSWLVTEDSGLHYHDEAKYPTFKFGGKTGQSVVTVVFKRDGLLSGIVRTETAVLDSSDESGSE
ncbi:putative Methyltransferase domain-containing protein [Septoria linicola]|nr:putative Methyltransferase domain-containing protein [Septoria linicola]